MTVAEMQSIRHMGNRMANWLYNQSQQKGFELYREDMQQMVRDWDDARMLLVTPRKRTKKAGKP